MRNLLPGSRQDPDIEHQIGIVAKRYIATSKEIQKKYHISRELMSFGAELISDRQAITGYLICPACLKQTMDYEDALKLAKPEKWVEATERKLYEHCASIPGHKQISTYRPPTAES